MRPATSVDAFMTKPEVARDLFGVTKLRTAHIVIDRRLEPSVGEGAFFKLLLPDIASASTNSAAATGTIRSDSSVHALPRHPS